MRTQPLRIRREFVQKDNPRIRTDDYPYNAKRRGVSFSRAFLNAIAPRPSATPDESPDRVGPSCLRWAHLCLLCAQFKPEGTRTVAGHPAHPCIVPKRGEATTKQPASATGRPHRPTPPYDSSSSRFFLPLKSGQTPVQGRRLGRPRPPDQRTVGSGWRELQAWYRPRRRGSWHRDVR